MQCPAYSNGGYPGPYQGYPPPYGTSAGSSPPNYQGSNYQAGSTTADVFRNIENIIVENIRGRGNRRWQEVQGAYVMFPPDKVAAKGVVHFIGGAFVGAVPHIAYGTFLEALASKGLVVVTTPYATSFDHLRIADDCHMLFDRCVSALGPEYYSLPVWGVGHSLGATLQLLVSARYPGYPRRGNVLMSFNNRPASDAIPLLAPLIAPSATVAGPLLQQVMDNPLTQPAWGLVDQARSMSPRFVKQFLPLVEQVQMMYMDMARGTREFIPAPEETRRIIQAYYRCPRNMLVKFKSDSIDETTDLASMLSSNPPLLGSLDLSLKVLPGDHHRPLAQSLVSVPPQVARVGSAAASTGAELFGRVAQLAAETGVPSGPGTLLNTTQGVVNTVADYISASSDGSDAGRSVLARDLEVLADDIGHWFGVSEKLPSVATQPWSVPPPLAGYSPPRAPQLPPGVPPSGGMVPRSAGYAPDYGAGSGLARRSF